jgi:hypothetical protein
MGFSIATTLTIPHLIRTIESGLITYLELFIMTLPFPAEKRPLGPGHTTDKHFILIYKHPCSYDDVKILPEGLHICDIDGTWHFDGKYRDIDEHMLNFETDEERADFISHIPDGSVLGVFELTHKGMRGLRDAVYIDCIENKRLDERCVL